LKRFYPRLWRQVQRTGVPIDEINSVAMLGVAHAAYHHDPARARFSTLAAIWIRAEVSLFLRQRDRDQSRSRPMLSLEWGPNDSRGATLRESLPAREEAIDLDPPLPPSLAGLVAMLDDRSRQIVEGYCGVGCDPKSFSEMARERGLSRERIRQVFTCAIGQIREHLTPKGN
jgi:RNA polymerase primary sigma factor